MLNWFESEVGDDTFDPSESRDSDSAVGLLDLSSKYHVGLVSRFVSLLTPEERDAFKLKLSLRAATLLEKGFEISNDSYKALRLSYSLSGILATHSYRDRIPTYGVAGRFRGLLSRSELIRLRDEAFGLRGRATLNFDQQRLVHADEVPGSFASSLGASRRVLALVESVAGPCKPTYVATYVYYDTSGMRSEPHVDNNFSAVTLMILLRHENPQGSTSVSYWPGSPRLEIAMIPGDVLVFFGSSVLHGRTPVTDGENVTSLLLSFQPK